MAACLPTAVGCLVPPQAKEQNMDELSAGQASTLVRWVFSSSVFVGDGKHSGLVTTAGHSAWRPAVLLAVPCT